MKESNVTQFLKNQQWKDEFLSNHVPPNQQHHLDPRSRPDYNPEVERFLSPQIEFNNFESDIRFHNPENRNISFNPLANEFLQQEEKPHELLHSNYDFLQEKVPHIDENEFVKSFLNKKNGDEKSEWIKNFEKFEEENKFESYWNDVSAPKANLPISNVPTQWKEDFNKNEIENEEESYTSQYFEFLKKMEKGDITINEKGEVIETGPSLFESFLKTSDYDEKFLEEFNVQYKEHLDEMQNMKSVWDTVKEFQEMSYQFQKTANRYRNAVNPSDLGIQLYKEGNLKDSIEAFEESLQRDPSRSKDWCNLGLAQAENENDFMAIKALQKALLTDQNNLEACIALATSHTNEFQVEFALQTLIHWVDRNPKYQSYLKSTKIPRINMDNVELVQGLLVDLFGKAIKDQPNEIDPDLHISLGLLYTISSDYLRASDCFQAALTKRPEDFRLWNKLGATIANSNEGIARASEAIDCYERALEMRPNYTRARTNLGVSHFAKGDYTEAAKSYLGALSIKPEDETLWSQVLLIFQYINRPDLIERTKSRNVDLFRKEFDF